MNEHSNVNTYEGTLTLLERLIPDHADSADNANKTPTYPVADAKKVSALNADTMPTDADKTPTATPSCRHVSALVGTHADTSNAVPDGENATLSALSAFLPPVQLREHLLAWLADYGRPVLETPTPDGRRQVLITHDADHLLNAADGAPWWVLRTVDGQLLEIHGHAPVDAVIVPDPAPLPDAVTELLLRYAAGQFEPEVRAYLSQIFTHNPDDALELLVQVARELGLTGALEVLAEPMGGQA